ncbi:uncharacterized protein METZ01_LOCUS103163, partial [marine metagenome]
VQVIKDSLDRFLLERMVRHGLLQFQWHWPRSRYGATLLRDKAAGKSVCGSWLDGPDATSGRQRMLEKRPIGTWPLRAPWWIHDDGVNTRRPVFDGFAAPFYLQLRFNRSSACNLQCPLVQLHPYYIGAEERCAERQSTGAASEVRHTSGEVTFLPSAFQQL